MGHSIKEIGEIINRKPAMIYNYIKEDKAFFYSHRKTKDKCGYIYDDEALNRLIKRVSVENEVVQGINKKEDEEIPKYTSPIESDIYESKIKELELKIGELEEKCGKYEGELSQLKNENRELINQNGNLLMLLSQEKQEKQALLPAPKKTIKEKIKSMFSRG